MKTYLQANLEAYEAIAHEFQTKRELRRAATLAIVQSIDDRMRSVPDTTILELGPGSGEVAHLLSSCGYTVTAIEFSPLMARLAEKTAPNVHMIVDEFLAHDFGEQRFGGIVGNAFIHLFTPEDADLVMAKIASLLTPDGILYLSTTKHREFSTGYVAKDNFENKVKRFRVQYTPERFKQLMVDAGLSNITRFFENVDTEADRTWMCLFCRRP